MKKALTITAAIVCAVAAGVLLFSLLGVAFFASADRRSVHGGKIKHYYIITIPDGATGQTNGQKKSWKRKTQ